MRDVRMWVLWVGDWGVVEEGEPLAGEEPSDQRKGGMGERH